MNRRNIIAFIALAAIPFVWWVAHARENARIAELAGVEKARQDSTIYYRVRASYRVKETSEALEFDFVVNCNMRKTKWKSGDTSYDMLGMFPEAFILPTRENHAVMVSTPTACNPLDFRPGIIPDDLFPFVVWFDDVNDLRFGWGYASEDAYENPNGHLLFKGATITRVMHADWQAWRDAQERLFKPVGKIENPWGLTWYDRATPDQIARKAWIPRLCAGYVRAELTPAAREIVRKEWEARGKPEFWVVADRLPVIGEHLSEAPQEKFVNSLPYVRADGRSAFGVFGGGGGGATVATRVGGGTILYSSLTIPVDRVYGAPVFPRLPYIMSSSALADPNSTIFPRRVIVDVAHRGFVACGGRTNTPEPWTLDFGKDETRRLPFYVNDSLVAGHNQRPLITFFERDEFLYNIRTWAPMEY